MIIPIDENWRIKSDECCWVVQARGSINKKTGELYWHSKKYLSSLPKALAELQHLQIRLHDSETLEDAIKFINETEKKFNKLLEAHKDD